MFCCSSQNLQCGVPYLCPQHMFYVHKWTSIIKFLCATKTGLNNAALYKKHLQDSLERIIPFL